MNLKDIEKKLNELFIENRIVFWNDAEGKFEEILEKLDLKKYYKNMLRCLNLLNIQNIKGQNF